MSRSTTLPVPRRLALVAALILAAAMAALPISARPTGALVETPIGLGNLLAGYGGTAVVRGIATFDAVPTAAQIVALEGLGLTAQPMHNVSLALVRGPVAAIQAAVASGVANDVYPDEPIQLFDTASSDAMGAATLRAAGAFTFEVSGELAVSDPDTLDSESLLGRMVTLQVAQLVRS